MKKIYITLVAIAVSMNMLSAQQMETDAPVLKSKNGINILPEEGNWGLGIAANPFLQYFGNIFNGSTDNNAPSFTPSANPTNNIAIFGKYVADENTFYRARFNVGVGQSINKGVINQNSLTPNPQYPAFTEDWRKTNDTQLALAIGIEKRRGSSRVQGLYGAELVGAYSNTSYEYQYGNPITSDFHNPITYNFNTGTEYTPATRVLTQNNGDRFMVGARGFLGVEYFIAPKVSIGGEFGYMLSFQTQGRAKITTESWESINGEILETNIDRFNNGGLTFLGAGLDNFNSSINLMFYF